MFNDREAMSLTLAPIVGTGFHLKLDNEVTLRVLGMVVVHRRSSAL